ncbi:hypothetical protein DL763_008602 [Monosporascus cannonballus]|nr:hypothetical protein DL763_008602 [Monosporascus cannonballus]
MGLELPMTDTIAILSWGCALGGGSEAVLAVTVPVLSSLPQFGGCGDIQEGRGCLASRSDRSTIKVWGGKLRRVRVVPLRGAEREFRSPLTDREVWSPESALHCLQKNSQSSPHMPIHSILSDDTPARAADHIGAAGFVAFRREIDAEEPDLSSREIYAVPMIEPPRFAFDPFLQEGERGDWHGEDISHKTVFADVNNPEPDGSTVAYGAPELKDRGAPGRYIMIARAGKCMPKLIGSHTPAPLLRRNPKCVWQSSNLVPD